MKTILLTLASLASTAALAAPMAKPKAALFDAVAKAAQEQNLFGYDVTVCLDERNEVVLGAVSFWNSPMSVMLVNSSQQLKAVKMAKNKVNADVVKFTVAGRTTELRLGTVLWGAGKPGEHVFRRPSTLVSTGASLNLNCFTKTSGME